MDQKDRPDEELVLAFKRGSYEAFEELYRRYKDKVYFYALSIMKNEALAEEAMQEAFLGFIKNLGTFRPGRNGSFKAYLFSSARNKAIDLKRKNSRETALGEAGSRLRRPGKNGPGMEEKDFIASALLSLPREQREVVVLKVFEGFTFREISGILNIPGNTAASRYRYGMEKLKRILQGSREV